MRTMLIVLTALLTGGIVAAAPAGAVTGGTVDKTNVYSNVGMIIFYSSEGRFRCSATLIAPKVLITAAHCTDGTLGDTLVNFSPEIAKTSQEAAVTIPRAKDDQGDGMSATGYRGAPQGLVRRKGVHT